LWIYLPMLLAAPTDVVALNFFFDTLLFCGAILLLATRLTKNQLRRGFNAESSSRRADCGACHDADPLVQQQSNNSNVTGPSPGVSDRRRSNSAG
ncbi:MAG TPA: hypothetical protein VMZ30_09090, partial [Pyrinomonadaceae bacterium]|nr:hypothetical protein [Pyrinomonadaceae bacterium]